MLGQILFIDAVGAHQRQCVAPSLGGEGDGIGRDGDATFEHQAPQGVGGGVAVETEPTKEGIPRRAREVAPRFEQGFEEILGAFVAAVVLPPREVAPHVVEEGFHTPESEGKGGHRPRLPCFGGRAVPSGGAVREGVSRKWACARWDTNVGRPPASENSTTMAKNCTVLGQKSPTFLPTAAAFLAGGILLCANIHKLCDLSTTMICKIGFLDIVKLRDDGC